MYLYICRLHSNKGVSEVALNLYPFVSRLFPVPKNIKYAGALRYTLTLNVLTIEY